MVVSKSSPLILKDLEKVDMHILYHKVILKQTLLRVFLDDKFIRKNKAEFPEVAELDLVRHYTELSNKTLG